MIDRPGRAKPRFPPEKEPAVRQAIENQLLAWKIGPGTLAVSGAANGADLLFAEGCRQRGAHLRLLLALPEPEYLEQSVRLPGNPAWETRFHALLRDAAEVWFQPALPEPTPGDLDVFSRCNVWILQTAQAEAPAGALYGVLVWDETGTGDGPGGTAHFAREIQRTGGGHLAVINPLKL